MEARSQFVHNLEQPRMHEHRCLLYQSQDEQLAAVVPFVRGGLAENQRCLYLWDDTPRETILAALQRCGIAVEEALASGALQMVSARDAYLPEGQFDPDRMIRLLEEAVADAKKAGFTGLRVAGETAWARESGVGSERLLEYEARANRVFARLDIIGLCQYHSRRFPATVLRDIIRTHPLIVQGGTVCHNAYYVPPEELLHPNGAELEVRRLLYNLRHRQLAEERLRDYVAHCLALIDTTCDGFLMMSESGRIVDVNNAYCTLSGYSRTELLQMNIADLRIKETPDEVAQRFKLIKDKGTDRFETCHRTRDGEVLFVEVSSTFLPLTCRFVNFIRDVSERKRTEEKLRQAVRDVENLLKEVHHRVKNNLSIIVALLNLQCESIQDSACQEALRDSQNRVYSMATVHQLLNNEQMIRGLDLGQYVHDLCKHLIQVFMKDPEQVKLTMKVDPVTLGVDTAVPFGLILNELVSNALKHAFTPSIPSLLQVGVRGQVDGPVILSVQDNGIGLPAEMDFHHARSLGLRLVNSLAKQIGGSVEVVKSPGTTVRVSFLPRRKASIP